MSNKWKLLYDRGDITKISEENEIDPRKVSKGLKGECDTDVFNAISKFYDQRKEVLKTA